MSWILSGFLLVDAGVVLAARFRPKALLLMAFSGFEDSGEV